MSETLFPFLLAAAVSAWDKTAAISGVVAASIAVLGLLAWTIAAIRGYWPTWRSRRAADLEVPGYALVGSEYEETVIVRLRRNVYCLSPSLLLSDSNQTASAAYEIPGIRSWTDPWLDTGGNKHKFPKALNRGDELRTTLHVAAEQTWSGVLRAEAWIDGRCAFQVRKPFEVRDSS